MENKIWKGWKILAIIFIILFVLENIWIGFGLYAINQENKKINLCYFEVCNEYPDASYQNNVCYCYDYDLIGNYQIAKTKVME